MPHHNRRPCPKNTGLGLSKTFARWKARSSTASNPKAPFKTELRIHPRGDSGQTCSLPAEAKDNPLRGPTGFPAGEPPLKQSKTGRIRPEDHLPPSPYRRRIFETSLCEMRREEGKSARICTRTPQSFQEEPGGRSVGYGGPLTRKGKECRLKRGTEHL